MGNKGYFTCAVSWFGTVELHSVVRPLYGIIAYTPTRPSTPEKSSPSAGGEGGHRSRHVIAKQ